MATNTAGVSYLQKLGDAMPSAKLPPVILSDDERATLHEWTRRRRTAQAMALWARIILAASAGATNTAIGEKLGVVIPTVGKWRRRFLRQRIAGLLDEPRVGAPRKISDADVENLINGKTHTVADGLVGQSMPIEGPCGSVLTHDRECHNRVTC